MADQASVTTTAANGRSMRVNSPFADGVIGNLAELGGDIATLAELQVQLAVADAKESASRAAIPLMLLGAGLVLTLAALPVGLIGVAMLLAEAMHLSQPGWAYLIVAGVVVATTVVLTLVGLPRLTRSFATLVRSKEELARNVAWVKTVLANSGRRPVHKRN